MNMYIALVILCFSVIQFYCYSVISVLSALVFSVVICECFKRHILENCDGLRPVSLTTLPLKLLRCLKFCFRFCWKTWKKFINDLKNLEKTWNLFAKNGWLSSSILEQSRGYFISLKVKHHTEQSKRFKPLHKFNSIVCQQGFSLRVLLNVWLIFRTVQPGVVYKSFTYNENK